MEDDGITVTMPKAKYEELLAAQPKEVIKIQKEYETIKTGSKWGAGLAFIGLGIALAAMLYFGVVGWGWYVFLGIVGMGLCGAIAD
jgi:hypothetical protein